MSAAKASPATTVGGPGTAAGIAGSPAVGSQTERDRPAPASSLRPAKRVRAVRGRGQVTITWQPVDGAAGYVIQRGRSRKGPFGPIDDGGGDVLVVPHGPYVDTTAGIDAERWYAVAAVASTGGGAAALSSPARVETLPEAETGVVGVRIDASDVHGTVPRPWRPSIGSEHLALLLRDDGPAGAHVGDELAEAFRMVRVELGVEAVRAHGILDDNLGVYAERGGRGVHDFARVDVVLDRLLGSGLRPIVDLSFMPADLAADPHATVPDGHAIVSPPRDWDRWERLVRDLVGHVAERYGRDEVAAWAFAVWSQPNLRTFWTGSQADYFRLYDVTAQAVKAVDRRFRVGGPATAAAAWVDDLLAHAAEGDVPLDFLATHTHAAPPLDLRPVAARYGRAGIPLWWADRGVSSTGSPAADSVWSAPLVCRAMRSAAGRLESLAYSVVSDHDVESGQPPALFHGGPGLLTIGNLRKPRYWALAILERLGRTELGCAIGGDGGGSLVEAWGSRDDDGRVAIAVWNGTLDRSRTAGDPGLGRRVDISVEGLAAGQWRLRHHRVDAEHSNIRAAWQRFAAGSWPDEAGWRRLRELDRLEAFEPDWWIDVVDDGRAELSFELPMPAVSLVELVPVTHADQSDAEPIASGS